MRTWQYGARVETPASPRSPRRKSSFGDIFNRSSLKNVKRIPSDSDIDGHDEDEKSRGRRVLRKNPRLSKSLTRLSGDPRESPSSRNESEPRHRRSSSRLTSSSREDPGPRRSRRSSVGKSAPNLKSDFSDDASTLVSDAQAYWPLEFLPESCPNTRIMTWGSQMRASKGRLLPAQNNIFTHAEEMLRELAALREKTKTIGRAVIFIAHSLGGIIVKEVRRLAYSHIIPAGRQYCLYYTTRR